MFSLRKKQFCDLWGEGHPKIPPVYGHENRNERFLLPIENLDDHSFRTEKDIDKR